MKSHTGTYVEVSESKAEQLNQVFGWKYPDAPESPSEAVSEPVTATPAPKKRGRPRKDNTNG